MLLNICPLLPSGLCFPHWAHHFLMPGEVLLSQELRVEPVDDTEPDFLKPPQPFCPSARRIWLLPVHTF